MWFLIRRHGYWWQRLSEMAEGNSFYYVEDIRSLISSTTFKHYNIKIS